MLKPSFDSRCSLRSGIMQPPPWEGSRRDDSIADRIGEQIILAALYATTLTALGVSIVWSWRKVLRK